MGMNHKGLGFGARVSLGWGCKVEGFIGVWDGFLFSGPAVLFLSVCHCGLRTLEGLLLTGALWVSLQQGAL